MSYTRLAHRAQGLACFIAPALLALAFLQLAARYGSLFVGGAIMNDTRNQLEYHFFGYWAYLLMIPALFALAYFVGQKSPRLAVMCAVFALLGLGAGVAQSKEQVDVAVSIRDGFPINWDFFINIDSTQVGETLNTEQLMEGVCLRGGRIVRCGPPGTSVEQLILGLPVLLYFIAHILLAVGIVRTGALPKWSGLLLIAAALLNFDSTGPQPSGVPLLTGLLSALCLLVVYSMVGLRLWRGEAEAPIMQGQRALA